MTPVSLLQPFHHCTGPAMQFRFNVREVEMGTRRPLIVQMYHDPTAHEPRCRLQARHPLIWSTSCHTCRPFQSRSSSPPHRTGKVWRMLRSPESGNLGSSGWGYTRFRFNHDIAEFTNV
eukprot:scaffold10558_cov21-Tisochrysis_lutea.AAC.1